VVVVGLAVAAGVDNILLILEKRAVMEQSAFFVSGTVAVQRA
jgi:hypothetical protein